MSKKYFIIETEGEEQVPHITVDEDGDVGLVKFGEEQGRIQDNGNGFNVHLEGVGFHLDYSNFCYLYDMMTVMMKEDKNLRYPYKLLKDE